jgi:hypothetical protein
MTPGQDHCHFFLVSDFHGYRLVVLAHSVPIISLDLPGPNAYERMRATEQPIAVSEIA